MEQKVNSSGRLRVLAVAFLFGVTIFLLLTISGLAWTSRAKLDAAQDNAVRLRNIERHVNNLSSMILVMETNQRGYLLTNDEAYLAPYRYALREKNRLVKEILPMLKEYPGIQNSIQTLLEKIAIRDIELDRAISLRRESGFEEALATLSTEGDTFASLEVKDVISSVNEEIEAMLVSAEKFYRTQLRRTTYLMNYAAGTALIAGLVGLSFLIGHLSARNREAELEREKAAAEKADREKSKFLASMNHEIRTPLNAMLGFSELLSEEVTTPRGKRFLSAIDESGRSLAELINDILDLSKIESGFLDLDEEPIRLTEFAAGLNTLFEGLAGENGLDFRTKVVDGCPEVVTVDAMRLRQVLVNLLSNAFKFTENGSVSLSIDAKSDTEAPTCELRIEVADTGCGIAREKQRLIFKPFLQAKQSDEMKGGTGLGLSISNELVGLMGGRIECESEPGNGALFRVIVPDVEVGGNAPDFGNVEKKNWNFNHLVPSRVLVVDDNSYNRELIGGFFENTHHTVEYAANGLEGLNRAKENSYDLVLMDIRMPVMNGEEAREKMLEEPRLSDIPVVAITASSLLREERRLRKIFDGYLRKPFTGAKLYSVIENVIEEIEPSEGISEPDQSPVCDESRPLSKIPPEAEKRLRVLYDSRWEALTTGMVFSEIVEVADELKAIAAEYSLTELDAYSDSLKGAVGNFDQVALEGLLEGFSETFPGVCE